MYLDEWIGIGVAPCPLGDWDSLTKSQSGGNLLDLLTHTKFKIAAEKMEEIRRKSPAAKHYIVYLETIHGSNDFHAFARGGSPV